MRVRSVALCAFACVSTHVRACAKEGEGGSTAEGESTPDRWLMRPRDTRASTHTASEHTCTCAPETHGDTSSSYKVWNI